MKKALFFVLLFVGSLAQAQQYYFKQFSVKDGLAQSQVQCLFQDNQGYIWVGTLGGISRFDGRKFSGYSMQDQLISNHVTSIGQLNDGRMIFGFVGGIAILENGVLQNIPFTGDHKDFRVYDCVESNDGGVLVGTTQGVFELKNNQLQKRSIFPTIDDGRVLKIIERTDETIFVCRYGIFSSLKTGIEGLFFPEKEDMIFDAAFLGKTLYVATKGSGMVKVDESSTSIISTEEGLISSTITGIEVVEDQLWIQSRYGVSKYDGKHFLNIDDRNGLPNGDIKDILCDREGNIWLGSNGSGILKFTGEQFVSITDKDGMGGNIVMSITQDTSGAFWFSTYEDGLTKIDGEVVDQFRLEHLTGNNSRFWTSCTRKNGDLCFGSSQGLISFKNNAFTMLSADEGLPDRVVLSVYESSDEKLWVGTSKGVCLVEDEEVIRFDNYANAPQGRIRGIHEDGQGIIWLASNEGIYRFDGNTFKLFDESNGLSDKSTYCITTDKLGRVWVGTANGMYVLLNQRFSPMSIEDGFGSNHINFLKHVAENLWVGTNNGIYLVTAGKSLDLDHLEIKHFSEDDGIASHETNLNAVFEDHEGKLWFGTTEGAFRYDQSKHKDHSKRIAPTIEISEVLLNLQAPNWSDYKAEYDENSALTHVTVDHRSKHFTFYYNGISTTYPNEVKYQYMLEGIDDDWQPATPSNYANYSNLSFGDYVFKVKAISKEGIVGNADVFSFTITPPFWLTWWFVMLEIITVLAVAFYFYRRNRRDLYNRLEKEKYEFRSKMLSLEQQSLNSSMNRHFIFNALNSIQYYINRKDRLSANLYLSAFAKLIRKNLDSSQVNFTSLREEVERLELYLKLEHMRFKDKFHYSIEIDPNLDQDMVKVPAMLLQPFLENSIWHGILPKGEGGSIRVSIDLLDDQIDISIVDDGIGVETSKQQKMNGSSHISQGMNITTDRIELLKKISNGNIELRGPYEIHDKDGQVKGTSVDILLPLNYAEILTE